MKNTNENLEITNKVIMYAFNYEQNFCKKAFNGSLGEHLQNKFSNYYSRFGNGEQSFLWLFTSLSNENKKTLIDFINKTFN